MEELPALVREIPEAGRKLAEKYWPGPLTMIFPKKDVVPYGTTGGAGYGGGPDAVGPGGEPAHKAGRYSGGSAQLQYLGAAESHPGGAVIEDMDGKIEMILDGGQVGIGVESTIVDVSGRFPLF